jgi:anti-sigma factor RsiW
MSCPSIEKWIPLFVEGDLSERRTEKVRRHIEGCARCRSLTDSYRLSQRWLRSAPPLDVGGATLEGLRRSVWKRIGSEPAPSPAWRQIERAWAALRHWTAQPAMATLALFVVVTGSFALSRVTGPALGPAAHHRLENQDPATSPASDESAAEPVLARASQEEGDEMDPASGDGAEPGVASDDSMRIEIQTRDPDVRIIWFSPTEDRAPPVED